MTPAPNKAEPTTGSQFAKYSKRGAYHWLHLSRDVRHHHCYTAARYAIVLELLGNCRDKKVLDVGCGDGALASLIAKRGALVTGCEPQPEGRRLATEMFAACGNRAEFISSITDLPQGTFDAVVIAEVIEHLAEPEAMLEEMRRVLKPGGLCVLSTPIRLTEQPFDREHVHEFWAAELANLLSKFFTIREHRLSLPVFWLEAYYWRPFGVPIPKLVMNVLSAWFGIRLLCWPSPLGRYYTLQCIVSLNTLPLDR